MRTFAFTLSALAIGVAIHRGLEELLYFGPGVIKVMTGFAHLFLPMIATAGIAYAMRIPHIIYVYFAVILSPFVSWGLGFLFDMVVLHERVFI